MRLNPAAIELAVTMPLVPSHLEKELAATSGRPGGFLTTSLRLRGSLRLRHAVWS